MEHSTIRKAPRPSSPFNVVTNSEITAVIAQEVPLSTFLPVLLQVLSCRRLRSTYFRSDLFSDPAWDILLEVTLAHAEQRRITVTNLCDRIDLPATTVGRWIKNLADQELLLRRHNPIDARVRYIELSQTTASLMRRYLLEVEEQLAGMREDEQEGSVPVSV